MIVGVDCQVKFLCAPAPCLGDCPIGQSHGKAAAMMVFEDVKLAKLDGGRRSVDRQRGRAKLYETDDLTVDFGDPETVARVVELLRPRFGRELAEEGVQVFAPI